MVEDLELGPVDPITGVEKVDPCRFGHFVTWIVHHIGSHIHWKME
jgi:hypothetical protein